MSEKANTQSEASQKVVTRYDRKVQRRKEEERKEKKRRLIGRAVGVALLIVVAAGILSVPVKKYVALHSAYITVGGHKITRLEFDYYYNMTLNDYINTYGSMLSYMGLDIYGDLSEQAFSDTLSWKDYFDRLTVDSIKQNKALADAAAAAGFVYDAGPEYADFEESVEAAAAQAGESVREYYKETFGSYATASRLKPYVVEGFTVNAYYLEVADSKEAAEEEIQSYYEENAASYDSVDYRITEVEAEFAKTQPAEGTDGEPTAEEPTEEEIQAAMEKAKEQADAALEVIAQEGEERVNVLKASVSFKYSDWLFDDARKPGDTTIIEDADNHKYYVLQFDGRYLDEALTVNVRAIASTVLTGEEIIAEWQTAGASEEAFIALVEKYSEDDYTNKKEGLYEEMMPSTLNDIMAEWMFDSSRKAGDVNSFEEGGYTYVLYFVGNGRPEWQVKIAGILLSETMNTYLTELTEAYEVSDPKGHLKYLQEQEAAETAVG